MSLLLTGFGPFETVLENPSELLVRTSGKPYEVVDVSYSRVKHFIHTLAPNSFDTLLLLGAHGTSDKFQIELTARNKLDARPDASGFTPVEGPIDPTREESLQGTLWPRLHLETLLGGSASLSEDAGGYLCNYIYFEALHRFPDKQVGFLHVPLLSKMPFQEQREFLRNLLARIEAQSD